MTKNNETSHFTNRLRDEIETGQSRRHDFHMKKLAFTTGLLGLGSLGSPVSGERIDVTSLLWLLPVVAFAFDLYIVSEDYGVKRAGAFLGKVASRTSEAERVWESEFLHQKNNQFAPIAFFIVSIVLWASAATLLWQSDESRLFIAIWSIVILLAESSLLLYSVRLRSSLRSDMYEDFDRLVGSLRLQGLDEPADSLHALLHETAWTTSSELLGELGVKIREINKQYNKELNPETKRQMRVCLSEIKKVWR